MRTSNSNRNLISFALWGASIVFWIILIFNPGNMTVQHCHVSLNGGTDSSFEMLLAMNPFSDMMTAWILMVFAMMLPKLIVPIQMISEHSFKHMRFLMIVLFVAGYTTVWIFAGFLSDLIILYANFLMPASYIPAVIFGIVALIWQFSPVKQICLNKGHYHPVLAAWGMKAHIDSFRFGLNHGVWCVGAGWALMLFPMLLPVGHHLAMLVVTFIMLSEHMEHPQTPRWRVDFRLKLMRILLVQNFIKR